MPSCPLSTNALQPLLHVREVAGRGVRASSRCDCASVEVAAGSALSARHHVHPVQRVQVVEVHDVVVHVLRADHQVADEVGVGRDLDVERVLDRADRGDGVHQGADAADALREGPGVARVAAPQDDLDAAHHRAGRVGLGDPLSRVDLRLDAQVALDAGDRVDDDPLAVAALMQPPRSGCQRPARAGSASPCPT